MFPFASWKMLGPKITMNPEIIHYLCYHENLTYIYFLWLALTVEDELISLCLVLTAMFIVQ